MNVLKRIFGKFKSKWFMFGNFYQPIIPFRVNILYWRKSQHSENVGDLFSVIVLSFMKEFYNINKTFTFKTIRLASIGSLIQSLNTKTTVWGSGIISPSSFSNFNRNVELDIRSVRGPKTRELLLEKGFYCPENFGDPALLFPDFYTPSIFVTKYDYLVIPHHLKINQYLHLGDDIMLSTITSDWRTFIDKIYNSQLVISASLHGIIIAEAYGIPAILLNDIQYDMFKYQDYYCSTGRFDFLLANSIEEALAMEKPAVPDMSLLKRQLYESFPVDLWK